MLTSVAMIPGIHDAYLFNFFKVINCINRFGYTGLVNFIVLPPKYYQQIEDNLTQSEYKMYELFSSRCNELLLGKFDSDHSNDLLNKLMGVINKTETLTGYQKTNYVIIKQRR